MDREMEDNLRLCDKVPGALPGEGYFEVDDKELQFLHEIEDHHRPEIRENLSYAGESL